MAAAPQTAGAMPMRLSTLVPMHRRGAPMAMARSMPMAQPRRRARPADAERPCDPERSSRLMTDTAAAPATAPPPAASGPGAPDTATSATQPVLGPWMRAQALNLARHTAALRDFTREGIRDRPGSADGRTRAGGESADGELAQRADSRARRMIQPGGIGAPAADPRALTALVTHKHQRTTGSRASRRSGTSTSSCSVSGNRGSAPGC